MYVTEAFKKTHTTFKALDIVINNAGILDDRRWELEIAINVVSLKTCNIISGCNEYTSLMILFFWDVPTCSV